MKMEGEKMISTQKLNIGNGVEQGYYSQPYDHMSVTGCYPSDNSTLACANSITVSTPSGMSTSNTQ